MSDQITIIGFVATVPRHLVTAEGLPITSFRLASTQRRFDRSQEKWVDGDTNWYTVTAFRQLAVNAAGSINKGDRIIVNGRLRIREWENGERTGTTIDIEADCLGHDLGWGTASFSRTISSTPASAIVADDAQFPSAVSITAATDRAATDRQGDGSEGDAHEGDAATAGEPDAPDGSEFAAAGAIPTPF